MLCLIFIAAFAFIIRCLHLFDSDHYYIVSPDSYFFHWMAELVQSDETGPDRTFIGHTVPTIWHTGLTYPLAYIARAISFIFGTSPEGALTFTSKFLPPTLAVISIIVIYLVVSRIYSQRVGLFSAFAWAILFQAGFTQAAGYLDRDGLSILLIMVGAFIFYLSRGWHWKIGKLDLGWVAGGLSVLAIEALLLLEWVWVGPVLLLTILTAFLTAEVLTGFVRRIAPSLMKADLIPLGRQSLTAMVAAIKESNWRPFALIVGLSALLGAITPGFPYMYRLATSLLKRAVFPAAGDVPVAELQGLGLGDLMGYWFMIIPLVIGLCITLVNRRRADLLWLSWFAILFCLGLFTNRVFLYTAPAACILSGLGLAFIFDFRKSGLLSDYLSPDAVNYFRYIKMAAALVLLLLLLLFTFLGAYGIGSRSRIAADNDWQDALGYLRDTAPEEAVIMSWWDYGYWILDLADRTPVVDGGFYSYSVAKLEDVGLAYCTSEPSEAVQVMQKYGADYLVFSRLEEDFFGAIAHFGLGGEYGDIESILEKLEYSLYVRVLSGDFQSGQGLQIVYRNDKVVVLKLQ